jgi:nucleoside-diphosphate-sugar epimerase
MKIIEQNLPAEIFSDQFVSFLDVWTLAEAILDLIAVGASGIVNVGAREVFSKAEFVQRLAAALGRDIPNARVAPMRQQEVLRGDSLGMDTSRVEGLLARSMPSLDDIINALVRQRASLGVPA